MPEKHGIGIFQWNWSDILCILLENRVARPSPGDQDMNETVSIGAFVERTELKDRLISRLSEQFPDITRIDIMTEGLHADRHQSFDILLISSDIIQEATIRELVTLLQESSQRKRICIISEKQLPDIGIDTPILSLFHLDQSGASSDSILEAVRGNADRIREERGTAPPGDEGISLFDNVPIGLFRIDRDGNFLDCNATTAALLKAPHREVVLEECFLELFSNREEQRNWIEIITKDSGLAGVIIEIDTYEGDSIWVRTNAAAVPTPDGAVRWYDCTMEDVTLQKKLEDKLSFLATHDMLTGLPNRNFFQAQAALTFSQARYNGDLVAILNMNIDDFSGFNARFGREKGDKLLLFIADKTKELMRKSDLIARIGGDTFVMLLQSIHTRRDIMAVASKVSKVFRKPLVIGDTELPFSCSMGIAIFPEHGEDANILIQHAEVAALTVKNREPGGFMIYSETIHQTPQA